MYMHMYITTAQLSSDDFVQSFKVNEHNARWSSQRAGASCNVSSVSIQLNARQHKAATEAEEAPLQSAPTLSCAISGKKLS